MKKSTLIRSDKPHAVKMSPGSNVAQRKTDAKKGPKEESAAPPENVQKVTQVKASKAKTSRTPAPTAPKPARARALSARQPEPAAPPPKPRRPRTKAAPPAPPAAPAEPVWELDNPVKTRIDQLRTRNAQLAEQLQRLTSTRPARGPRT